MNEEVLTLTEAAEFLKISKPKLYQLKARNKIPYHKKDGLIRFLKSELIEWIKG